MAVNSVMYTLCSKYLRTGPQGRLYGVLCFYENIFTFLVKVRTRQVLFSRAEQNIPKVLESHFRNDLYRSYKTRGHTDLFHCTVPLNSNPNSHKSMKRRITFMKTILKCIVDEIGVFLCKSTQHLDPWPFFKQRHFLFNTTESFPKK